MLTVWFDAHGQIINMANQHNWQSSRGLWVLTSTPVLVAATAGLMVLAVLSRKRAYLGLDLQIARAAQSLRVPGYSPVMKALSWSGYPPQVIGEIGLMVLLLFF